MDLGILKQWLELLSGAVALIAGLVAALWAYTKFVLERGLLPPIQFDVDCKSVGLQGNRKVLEILVHLRNVGTSTLVATNVRVDVLYLEATDEPRLFEDPERATFGRLCFPRSLRKELQQSDGTSASSRAKLSMNENSVTTDPVEGIDGERGISILPYDTFVQAGVDQVYTLVTAVPESTSYVLIWSSFQYAQHPSLLGRFILFLSRRLGLLQYSLSHVQKPHTMERVFPVLGHQAGGDAA